MKDHPYHRQKAVIGGSWGIKSRSMPMVEEIDKWPHNYRYGDDEKFLHWRVWERFRPTGDLLYHDFEGKHGGVTFPTHAPQVGHVCQPIIPKLELRGKWDAYVISPPHYKDRLTRFYANMRTAYNGFLTDRIKLWSGLPKGTPIPDDYHKKDSFPPYWLVTQDHMSVWKKAREDDLDWLFVFEDDATFIGDLDDYLQRALLSIPADWWAIQLGGQGWTDHKRAWYTDDRGRIVHPQALARVKGCLGMHGVMWSREGYNEAVKYFTNKPQSIVDWDFAEWQRQSDRFYSTMRWIVGIDNCAQGGHDT
jgi:hypothetical protein